jgi:uncharacterized membrane protein
MKAKHFIAQLKHDDLVAAIRKAEHTTSGEIRVFISRHDPPDVIAAAQHEFEHLKMNQTAERNGVLIYIAPRGRKFAVIGDSGVHRHCGDEFWQKVAAEMSGHFKKEEFTEGLLHGIATAGELLAKHFPASSKHPNQLPDDVAHD